ncbi:MAG TPA: RNA polymerase subunit sigma-70, partial [Myxococcota bacterium]
MDAEALLVSAQRGDERAFEALVSPYRRELCAHCYRMAGALDEADDLLQESLLRIWRGLPSFERRASLRTWMHKVVASTCLDRLKSRRARRRAEDTGPAATVTATLAPLPAPLDDDAWIGPCPPSVYGADTLPSPEARYAAKESVGFAFLAALQLLAPKQRAALIACDVLGFSAEEWSETLESTPASVRSALQRAREAIAERAPSYRPSSSSNEETRALADRYLAAWNRADGSALVALLHEEATMSMPPLPFWL